VTPRAWQAPAAPPHEAHFEERVETAHGWRWIAWSCKAVLDDAHVLQAVVASGRDVTERRRAEEQGRQHLQQLARVGRVSAMGEMASAIAHEVNQPLAALRTNAQACRRLLAAGNAGDDLAGALERIAAQAERAGGIIARLRGFMARDAGETMAVDPNYLIAEVVDLVRAEAEASGVRLQLGLAPALPQVEVDCIQIEQVLFNLVRNGIEALEQSGGDREVAIETRHDSRDVVVSVRDSGPGVPAALADRVFEAFFTTKPSGMGVGLAISRSIAEAHGGRLWLDAGAEGGAAFHLALPAQREGMP
jgi:C4-dicarboxylate-specific signal transduction histidine kinase